ncbi:hypothetical protein [Fulvivirga sediminis]|uniref:Uncharacterized protein n=1 Tax=Fulvivirga sediminis TaxID=2803949 RepID=A0A937JZD3_9BACT|nr:hypothetical protein [Fulvivirga sediminis]MBL3655165.1 hypothetical protein [Fulvivirga sediminis]
MMYFDLRKPVDLGAGSYIIALHVPNSTWYLKRDFFLNADTEKERSADGIVIERQSYLFNNGTSTSFPEGLGDPFEDGNLNNENNLLGLVDFMYYRQP